MRRPDVRRSWLLAALLSLATAGSSGALAAEGFGASTPGGAGYPLYRVTHLGDSGPGSLRDAVSQGGRTVVFDVGGEIPLTSKISIKGPFVTIDGSSAPFPGITLRHKGLGISGSAVHDVIVRGIRIRGAGAQQLNSSEDGIAVGSGAHDIWIDHVSVDGSTDGNIDITYGAHDVTVSWSVLSGCGKNMLVKYEASRVTLHHNVFVESGWRNPWVANTNDGLPASDTTVDFRNNLVANWGDGGGTGVERGARVNVVSNYYSSPTSPVAYQDRALLLPKRSGVASDGRAYTAGNRSDDFLASDLDARGTESAPFAAPAVTTDDACTAARDALAEAGANPPDAIDLAALSSIAMGGCANAPTPTPTPNAIPTATLPAVAATPIPEVAHEDPIPPAPTPTPTATTPPAATWTPTAIAMPTASPTQPAQTIEYFCAGRRVTIIGTEGPDKLIGTAGADVIEGLGGDDAIYGRQGHDFLCGGIGNDRLFGESGNDWLLGGDGADLLQGNGNEDFLRGGSGDDSVQGGTGIDDCDGETGINTLKDCE